MHFANPKQKMSQIMKKAMSETSPIKEILYEQINSVSEQKIHAEIAKNNTVGLIKDMIKDCSPKISRLQGSQNENFEAFAESLMHYLLTNALITSQRKITVKTTEVDIIIPDVRTLVSSPRDALIILFPKTNNIDAIQDRLKKIEAIQPTKENVWLVQKTNLGLKYKTYEIDKDCSFANIINDICAFSASKAHSKLKIFKV